MVFVHLSECGTWCNESPLLRSTIFDRVINTKKRLYKACKNNSKYDNFAETLVLSSLKRSRQSFYEGFFSGETLLCMLQFPRTVIGWNHMYKGWVHTSCRFVFILCSVTAWLNSHEAIRSFFARSARTCRKSVKCTCYITGKGKHSQMSAYTPLKGNSVRYCNTPMYKQTEEPKRRQLVIPPNINRTKANSTFTQVWERLDVSL